MNKPGYKTTEFWLTAAASIIGLLFASGIIPTDSAIDKMLGMAVVALGTLGYSVSRGIAKSGGTKLLLCGLFAGGLLMGCSTVEQGAFRTVGTTTTLVEAAMNGWGDYVRAGKATDAEQARVREAYAKYQGVMRVARAVTLSLKTGQDAGNPQWLIVLDTVNASANDLFALIGRYLPEFKPKAPAR